MVFMPKVDEAFSLYSKMLLGFGLMFQIPTVVFFLARMGVVTAGFLLKYFKYALLIITIVAAIVSPGTDAMSTIIYAVPMLALYTVSILIAWVFQKRKDPVSATN
jgi:sec-independent protein translocase protein TatC